MMDREVFNKLGKLDIDFKEGLFEDVYFCIKANVFGYKVLSVLSEDIHSSGNDMYYGDYPIFHVGRSTFKLMEEHINIYNRNKEIYDKKVKELLGEV